MKKMLYMALLLSCMLFSSTAIGKIVNITNQNQLDDLLKKEFVILKFTAGWCSACKLAKEPFEKLATKNEFAQIHFAIIDVDSNAEIAKKYGISSIPRFKFIKGGKEVHTEKGIQSLSLFDQYFSAKIKNKLLLAPTTDQEDEKEGKTCMFEGAKKFFREYFEWFKSYFAG